MRRPVIALGDALRALAALEPRDDEALHEVVRMLGLTFGGEVSTRAAPSLGAWKPSATRTVSTGPIQAPAREPERSMVRSQRPVLPSRIRRVRKGTGRIPPPAWLDEPGEVLAAAHGIGDPPRKRALFDRLSRRGILSAALATLVPEGELDLETILETIGQGRSLHRLPRLLSPTLRGGAQVLIDLGTGMDPFQEDQQQIVNALDDILSDDRLQVLYFAGCPSRGVGAGARETWAPWTPPPRGVPVVTLTDLGIGGLEPDEDRATPAEWLRFAHRVTADGYSLIALVPYEASRWPAALTRELVLIHWSERTTVGAIRRTMRHAWRRRR